MQRVEAVSSTGLLQRLPMKNNAVSPYVSTNPSGKHLRCVSGLQSGAPAAGNGEVAQTSKSGGRTRRGEKNAHLLAAKKDSLMDSLNYWKRQFNQQQEPATHAIPERLVRVVGGGAGRKAAPQIMLAKEEAIVRRPTPPAPAPPQHTHKHLPKNLLKTLSPIQNSPQFLNLYESMTAIRKGGGCSEFPVLEAENQAKKQHFELDSSATATAASGSSRYWGNNTNGGYDLENEPNKDRLSDYDDDLVFAIEI